MALANENYLKTPEIYCFDEVEKRVNAYKVLHPTAKIIRLGVGDVTRPLTNEVVQAMHLAINEMSHVDTFRGYSPPQGYDFLIEKILKEYRSNSVSLTKESIFISEGAKSDIGNLGHVLGRDNIIAIAEPVYPVYENATIMSGRAGFLNDDQKWSNVVYLRCSRETGFKPELPEEKVDIIYLCNPNNPTGTTLTKADLKKWVDYAIEHESIIIYDGAYNAYITEEDVPKSIYEIKGAKKVAVEIRSYSKTAGFTGLRCGYTIIPPELMVYTKMGEMAALNKLWNRRKANYTNGVSYVVQRGAEAIYSRKGKAEVQDLVNYYLTNASIIRKELLNCGLEVYGGKSSPYVWFRTPKDTPSWKFFHQLLYEFQLVGTPGVVFGQLGEGFMRFTGFSSREGTQIAMERIKNKI
ncbi:MAG: LL-diaminopimelate aminotransferase [Porphyromonadaceae bacterium CG2_30_38_12]|nr:MAG: LL-diaminopimelate aminotransferase [Porphyromonadaceae bacterium CG2_30_38_12]